MDISLLEINPDTNVVKLKLSSKLVEGLGKLVQMVVLSLLNTPGRDLLNPEMGGGIPEMVSMNYDATDYTEILAELAGKIKKTELEVLTDQIGSTAAPSEKLRSIDLISVGPGASASEIYAKIRIINELGQYKDVVM